MGRVASHPLDSHQQTLVAEQILRVRAARERKLKEFDAEIARLERMLKTGRVPQTCG